MRDYKNLEPSRFARHRAKGSTYPNARDRRKKGTPFPLVFIFLVALGGFIAIIFWNVPRIGEKLFHSEYFRIERIDVVGVKRADKDAIINAIGMRVGDNVLETDLQKIKERIEAIAWVRSVKVSRELPSKLVISVLEYDPVGEMRLDGKPVLVDRDGSTAPIMRITDEYPVFSGMESPESIVYGASLADALEKAGIAPHDSLHRITYDQSMGYAVTGKNGAEIRFGFPPFEKKIERLMMVLPDVLSRGAVDYVYLDFEDRVVVKNRE